MFHHRQIYQTSKDLFHMTLLVQDTVESGGRGHASNKELLFPHVEGSLTLAELLGSVSRLSAACQAGGSKRRVTARNGVSRMLLLLDRGAVQLRVRAPDART
jgi:hypothetical protein